MSSTHTPHNAFTVLDASCESPQPFFRINAMAREACSGGRGASHALPHPARENVALCQHSAKRQNGVRGEVEAAATSKRRKAFPAGKEWVMEIVT